MRVGANWGGGGLLVLVWYYCCTNWCGGWFLGTCVVLIGMGGRFLGASVVLIGVGGGWFLSKSGKCVL